MASNAGAVSRFLLGKPLRTDRLGETLLPKRLALPVFCSDPLSSVAYATEQIVLVLGLGGLALLHLTPWVAAAVVVLLVVPSSLRRPRPLTLLGAPATALYGFVIRPWHLPWGAEPEDEKRELPGDEPLPKDGTEILHAVTIDTPLGEVWPWLARLDRIAVASTATGGLRTSPDAR